MQRSKPQAKSSRPIWRRLVESLPSVGANELAPEEWLLGGESIPTSLGDWDLEELVSQGEWFRVYRAVRSHGDNQTAAALKVARFETPREESDDRPLSTHQRRCAVIARRMLNREAEILQSVQHNRLRWLLADGLGQRPGFVATPWFEGVTLAEHLRKSLGATEGVDLRLPQILWMARHTAEALAALHNSGWIHSQVRPHHLLLQKTRGTILLDLANSLRQESDESIAPRWYSGAAEYAAPEMHVMGTRLDSAVDIYALGAVLFHALAGRPPFVGAGPEEIALGHLRLPAPDVRQFHFHLPLKLAQLIRQMLSKDPWRRPTAKEMVERLIDIEISTLAGW
ncbi:MAG: protein kinase [Pirellulales bacterium]